MKFKKNNNKLYGLKKSINTTIKLCKFQKNKKVMQHLNCVNLEEQEGKLQKYQRV